MSKKRVYAALELADGEVRLAVMEVYEGRANVLRIERAPAAGLSGTTITDEASVVASIRQALTAAQAALGYRIERVVLLVPSVNVKDSSQKIRVGIEDGTKTVRLFHIQQGLTRAQQLRRDDDAVFVNANRIQYEVNGEKTDYFSYLFLKCSSHMSHKSKLSIVTKAVEAVQKEGYGEAGQYEAQMRAKSIIQEELEEKGGFVVEEIAERIFEEKPELKTAFQDKMEKYNMVKEEVLPQSETTTRKYQKQHLFTDTGIEIKIPMEQYKDPGSVEFITNEDGTVSVLIKNIGHLEARF